MTLRREKIEIGGAIKEPLYGKELKLFLGVSGYCHEYKND